MSLEKNSFSWSFRIPLCLKQVMVSHMHANHLRVWQTQLSYIASSCFDIDKTLHLTNMTLVLRECCVTPASKVIYIYIYIYLSQSKYWNIKRRSMSQNMVKENVRTIAIQQWFCYLRIHSCIFCTSFCLWDAKFLFWQVRGCNSIADLSSKKYSGLISL